MAFFFSFFTQFLIMFVKKKKFKKLKFVGHKNTTVGAAILCPAGCIIDIMSKAECVAKVFVRHEPAVSALHF